MSNASILFQIDPMAASSYGLYNSFKEGEGSFIDFLLNYDSKGANEGDNSWMTKLVNQKTLQNISSPEIAQALIQNGIDFTGFISASDYFDTKVAMYKLQIEQEIAKRGLITTD
jgi:3-methyladenine DNA glycosylase Tag